MTEQPKTLRVGVFYDGLRIVGYGTEEKAEYVKTVEKDMEFSTLRELIDTIRETTGASEDMIINKAEFEYYTVSIYEYTDMTEADLE